MSAVLEKYCKHMQARQNPVAQQDGGFESDTTRGEATRFAALASCTDHRPATFAPKCAAGSAAFGRLEERSGIAERRRAKVL